MGLDHSYFRPSLDVLGKNRPVIFYDHRGNGRSPDIGPLTLDALAADGDALRAYLGLPRVVVLGHSLGAAVAVTYAQTYTRHTVGVILCNPVLTVTQLGNALQRHGHRLTQEQADAFDRAFTGAIGDDGEFAHLWSSVLPLYFHNNTKQHVARFIDLTIFRLPAFTSFLHHFASASELISAVKYLDGPLLWLEGKHDWVRRDDVAEIAGSRSRQIKIFAHSGHFPFIEESDEFRRVVSDWLTNRVDGSGPAAS
jgi:proline iminopeptidase